RVNQAKAGRRGLAVVVGDEARIATGEGINQTVAGLDEGADVNELSIAEIAEIGGGVLGGIPEGVTALLVFGGDTGAGFAVEADEDLPERGQPEQDERRARRHDAAGAAAQRGGGVEPGERTVVEPVVGGGADP